MTSQTSCDLQPGKGQLGTLIKRKAHRSSPRPRRVLRICQNSVIVTTDNENPNEQGSITYHIIISGTRVVVLSHRVLLGFRVSLVPRTAPSTHDSGPRTDGYLSNYYMGLYQEAFPRHWYFHCSSEVGDVPQVR